MRGRGGSKAVWNFSENSSILEGEGVPKRKTITFWKLQSKSSRAYIYPCIQSCNTMQFDKAYPYPTDAILFPKCSLNIVDPLLNIVHPLFLSFPGS